MGANHTMVEANHNFCNAIPRGLFLLWAEAPMQLQVILLMAGGTEHSA
jgi:hypothetical protein